jgi:hypothetical protein
MPQSGINRMDEIETRVDQCAVQIEDDELDLVGIESAARANHELFRIAPTTQNSADDTQSELIANRHLGPDAESSHLIVDNTAFRQANYRIRRKTPLASFYRRYERASRPGSQFRFRIQWL